MEKLNFNEQPCVTANPILNEVDATLSKMLEGIMINVCKIEDKITAIDGISCNESDEAKKGVQPNSFISAMQMHIQTLYQISEKLNYLVVRTNDII